MSLVTLTLSDGTTVSWDAVINGVVVQPQPTPQPQPQPTPQPTPQPQPTPSPGPASGVIDITGQVGQKQYRFNGDFHLVLNNLQPSTRSDDRLGWVKIAPQIGGDMIPGDVEITGSNHDEWLKSQGNAAVSAFFTVGEDAGYPSFPVGGTLHIIGRNIGIACIVDVRTANH